MEMQDNGTVKFELTLPWKKVSHTYTHVLEEYSKNVEVKGFRKGKAPLNLVEAKVGQDALYQGVVEHLLPQEYAEYIRKNEIRPIVYPQIKTLEIGENKDWKFEITTAQRPKVELGDYKKYLSQANKSSGSKKTAKEKASPQDKDSDKKLQTLFDALLKEVKLDVSPLLVSEEAKANLSKLLQELEKLNLSIEDYAKSQKMTPAELVKEYENTAKSRLKLELILDEITKLENPEVTDEELAKLKVPADQKDYVVSLLKRQKTVDRLLLL